MSPDADVVSSPGRNEGSEQARQWLGGCQLVTAKTHQNGVVVSVDLIGGHGGDAAQGLGVEEHETASDPVLEGNGVVVK